MCFSLQLAAFPNGKNTKAVEALQVSRLGSVLRCDRCVSLFLTIGYTACYRYTTGASIPTSTVGVIIKLM